MKNLIETHIKPLADWDTAKVLGATTGSLLSGITLDGALHTLISILTIAYLCSKIWHIKKTKKDDDDL